MEEGIFMKNPLNGIRERILVATAIALLIPTLILGYIMYDESKILDYTAVTGTVTELKAINTSIEEIFNDAEKLILEVSQQPELQHTTYSFPSTTENYTNLPLANANNKTAFYIELFKPYTENRFIKNFYIGTNDGELYLSPALPPEVNLNDFDPRLRSWYIEAEENPGQIIDTIPYIDAGSGDSTVTFAKTVQDNNGKIIGVLAIDFDLNELAVLMREKIQKKTIFTIVVSFIIGMFFIIGFVRSITKRMKILHNGMNIVAKSDLTARINLAGNDELASIANNFDQTVMALQQLAKDVQSNITNVSDVSNELVKHINTHTVQSNEIRQAIEEIAQGATNQSMSAEENAKLVANLDEMIRHLVNDVSTTSDLTIQTSELSKEGYQNVVVLEQMATEGTKKNEETLATIEELNQKSSQIGEITKMITNLAEQTNLLALNAAIEAARAGEHGKGFAVVADEVRKLAEQSANSASSITVIVQEIQDEVKNSINSINTLKDNIINQNKAVDSTRQSFELITIAVNDTKERTEAIVQYLNEISNKKDGMLTAIESMSAVSQQTAASAEQVSATSDEQNIAVNELLKLSHQLENSSENLQEKINKYKL